jgi:hypothetical protein
VGLTGVGPATKRIQVQIQFGIDFSPQDKRSLCDPSNTRQYDVCKAMQYINKVLYYLYYPINN